jgi:hypothetical protein
MRRALAVELNLEQRTALNRLARQRSVPARRVERARIVLLRHRHQEWLKFLKAIDFVVPSQRQVHMIVDNYATHKHPKVQRWLRRHPRFHMHFTPTDWRR